MLFLLTGEVQIGKTRWLEALVDDLAASGVPSAGVLAPGQWVASTGEQADANGFEKRGIDNVLLPEGTRIPFARRRDIAQAEGSYDEESQAARAQLAWYIDDEAIAKVNAYFDQLGPAAAPGLLVVDELGRLEVWRGEGLTSAVRRLQEGRCTIELGFVLTDLLTNYERVSDHCSNIAVTVIQVQESAMEAHGYLNQLKSSGSPEFTRAYEESLERYALPKSGGHAVQ